METKETPEQVRQMYAMAWEICSLLKEVEKLTGPGYPPHVQEAAYGRLLTAQFAVVSAYAADALLVQGLAGEEAWTWVVDRSAMTFEMPVILKDRASFLGVEVKDHDPLTVSEMEAATESVFSSLLDQENAVHLALSNAGVADPEELVKELDKAGFLIEMKPRGKNQD